LKHIQKKQKGPRWGHVPTLHRNKEWPRNIENVRWKSPSESTMGHTGFEKPGCGFLPYEGNSSNHPGQAGRNTERPAVCLAGLPVVGRKGKERQIRFNAFLKEEKEMKANQNITRFFALKTIFWQRPPPKNMTAGRICGEVTKQGPGRGVTRCSGGRFLRPNCVGKNIRRSGARAALIAPLVSGRPGPATTDIHKAWQELFLI